MISEKVCSNTYQPEMIKLTDSEMQEVRAIAHHSQQTVKSLIIRLEKLTWGDGLLEFRMQSAWPGGITSWMDELLDLSNRINSRLAKAGIPLGPNRRAYQSWLAAQNKDRS